MNSGVWFCRELSIYCYRELSTYWLHFQDLHHKVYVLIGNSFTFIMIFLKKEAKQITWNSIIFWNHNFLQILAAAVVINDYSFFTVFGCYEPVSCSHNIYFIIYSVLESHNDMYFVARFNYFWMQTISGIVY